MATLAADFTNIITEGLRQEYVLFTQMKNKTKTLNHDAFSLKYNEERLIGGHLLSPHSTLFRDKNSSIIAAPGFRLLYLSTGPARVAFCIQSTGGFLDSECVKANESSPVKGICRRMLIFYRIVPFVCLFHIYRLVMIQDA